MNLRSTLMVAALTLSSSMLSSTVLAAPFVSKANGYTVTPPAGWQQKDLGGAGGVETAFFDAPKNKFSSNFNMVVTQAKGMQKISDTATLKAIGDQLQTSLSTSLAGFKLISRKTDTLSGQPAVYITYYGPNKLQLAQYVTIYKEKAYVLTFTAQPAEFAKLQTKFITVKNSFKFR